MSLLVSHVATNAPLVTLSEHASLVDALAILRAHKISSVPVVSSHGSPVGWVGWSEIIKFFVESIHNNKQVVGPKSHSVTRADLERLATADHKLKLLNAGSKQLKSVHADSPLTKALRLLSKGRQHHVPIVDAKGKLTGVLSQRDVLNYFAAHPEKIGADLRSATVSGLGMGTAHVLSVRESDVALDAFYEIASHNYQGAAVLDNDGRLVNALSVADAGLCEGDFSLLQRHVRAFVLWQAGVQLCDADTTVAQLAAQMSKAHVRRLFLVNNEKDRHVVGIVTASDVCGALFRAFRDQAKDEKKSSKKQQEPGKGKGKTKWQSHLEKQSNKKSSKGGNKSAAKKK